MLLLLSCFLVPALAILPDLPVPEGLWATVFAKLDLDANGELTKVELKHFIQQCDLNHDGVTLEAEIRAYIQYDNQIDLGELYTLLDIDSKTGITVSDIDLFWERFDVNVDGKITLLEKTLNTKLGR